MLAKKERGQYSAILTKKNMVNKDLLHGMKHQKIIFDLAGPSEKSRAGKILLFYVNAKNLTGKRN